MDEQFWLEWRNEINNKFDVIDQDLKEMNRSLGRVEGAIRPPAKEKVITASAGGSVGAIFMAMLIAFYEYMFKR